MYVSVSSEHLALDLRQASAFKEKNCNYKKTRKRERKRERERERERETEREIFSS